MAIGRVYNVDPAIGTGLLIGSTNPANEYPILIGGSAGEFNISAVRVAMISGVSASYPANGTITFRIRKLTNGTTFAVGVQGSTGTATPIGQSTTAAASVWTYATLANATGTASNLGTIAWEQTLPLTAGANWGEWFTPGFEINAGGGGLSTVAFTYEAGANSISTAANVGVNLVISE